MPKNTTELRELSGVRCLRGTLHLHLFVHTIAGSSFPSTTFFHKLASMVDDIPPYFGANVSPLPPAMRETTTTSNFPSPPSRPPLLDVEGIPSPQSRYHSQLTGASPSGKSVRWTEKVDVRVLDAHLAQLPRDASAMELKKALVRPCALGSIGLMHAGHQYYMPECMRLFQGHA